MSMLFSGTLSRAAAQSEPQAPDRIQNERPSAGWIGPFRWATAQPGRLLNWSLLALENSRLASRRTFSASSPDNVSKMFRPFIGQMGPGAGLGGGVRVYRPVFNTEIQATAGVTSRLYQRYSLWWSKSFGHLRAGPEAAYLYSPQEEFFGRGPDSVRDSRSNYVLKQRRAGWLTEVHLREVRVRHAFRLLRADIGPGTDSEAPTLQEVFPDEAGNYGPSRWLSNEFAVVIDHRDTATDPRDGGAIEWSAAFNHRLGQAAGAYTTVRASGTLYLPLSEEREHVIATHVEAVHNISKSDIPLFDQPFLGGESSLRGFRTARFRDRDSAAGTVEYRYRVWRYLDAVLFGDAGQVYANLFQDIGKHRLHYDAGIGARYRGPLLSFQLSVGESREGAHMFLSFGPSW